MCGENVFGSVMAMDMIMVYTAWVCFEVTMLIIMTKPQLS